MYKLKQPTIQETEDSEVKHNFHSYCFAISFM